jgi:hypothetical protein
MNSGTTICPKCANSKAVFANETITLTIPVRVKWLWFNISQDVKITVSPSIVYCAACGFLQVKLDSPKQI